MSRLNPTPIGTLATQPTKPPTAPGNAHPPLTPTSASNANGSNINGPNSEMSPSASAPSPALSDADSASNGDGHTSKRNFDDIGGDSDDGASTTTTTPTTEKRSGRRKIKIEYIEDKSRRHITFSKRKAGIMKKAYELSTLTGTQVLLLVVSETGLVYTFTTPKLQPLVTKPEGKNLIQACLNAPDPISESAVPSAQQLPMRSPQAPGYPHDTNIGNSGAIPDPHDEMAAAAAAGANMYNPATDPHRQPQHIQSLPPQSGYPLNLANLSYNQPSAGVSGYSNTSMNPMAAAQAAQQYGTSPYSSPSGYTQQQQPQQQQPSPYGGPGTNMYAGYWNGPSHSGAMHGHGLAATTAQIPHSLAMSSGQPQQNGGISDRMLSGGGHLTDNNLQAMGHPKGQKNDIKPKIG